jgi:chaperone required for assembly of F1-ATPase
MSEDDLSSLFSVDEEERRNHPMRSAQAAMRKSLPKRFYEKAEAREETSGGFRLLLDGKPALTPKRQPLLLPSSLSASILVAEWNAQEDVINPASMHATRVVNAAIDHVSVAMQDVRDDAARYVASDLICYHAREPERLAEMQKERWAAIIAFAEERFGVPLVFSDSLMHVEQDRRLLPVYRAALTSMTQPVALAAFHVMVTLSGSALIALAVAEEHVSGAAGFDASEVDADFEADIWGHDEEAAARRAYRLEEFISAAGLYHAVMRENP